MKHFILLLLLSLSLNLSAFECEVAACAVFKDEGPYIREWVEFHMAQGIRRFYLYDNLSCDRWNGELEDYICEGIVRIIPWPFEACDCRGFEHLKARAFMHCLERIKCEVKWCVFLDCNEFLFCKNCLPINIFLRKYKEFAAVGVNRQVFGTSDIWNAPYGCLIKTLFWKCHPRHDCCRALKFIVQPKHVEDCHHPRHFVFKDGKYAVDSDKNHLFNCECNVVLTDKIRINHYIYRDLNYFNTFYRRHFCNFCHEWCNIDFCFFDDCILRCVPELCESCLH